MKIATVSCIHGDIENMMKFMDKISLLNIDVLVCNGDFTDYAIPRGFNRIDIGRIIIEELKSMDKPLVTVPGGWDKELIALLKKETVTCHGEGQVIDGVGFYGYGGAKTPFNTPFEPSDSEIMGGLEKAYKDVKKADCAVQVTHAPPMNTKTDVIASGAHVGSDSVRKFIEKNKPDVAVCAHIHESRCVDELGNTKIVNSGRFPEGHLGIISIDDSRVTAKLTSLI